MNAPASSKLAIIALAAVLLLGVPIHWVKSAVMEIDPDDVRLMGVSREIDSSAWHKLWTRHEVHFFPLYRLLRLPFDLHFPAWYTRFHALLFAAHLASAALLFLLSRRYLRSPWSALVTSLLFAWSTVGDQALVWKGVAFFALSWTFTLLGTWCLTREGTAWGVAGGAALLCSLGLFSGVLLVLPGVLAAVWLLEPKLRRRAFYACGTVWMGGALAWLILVLPQLDWAHYWKFGSATAGPMLRLWWAITDLLLAYNYQFFSGVRLVSERHTALLFLPLLFLLVLVRRHLAARWIFAALAMTALPLFVMVLVRREPEVWKVSRYAYQAFTFWAVLLGAVLDGILAWLEPWPRRRAVFLALLPIPAALYWWGHLRVAEYDRAYFRAQPAAWQELWFGWDSFFRFASEDRVRTGTTLVLPDLLVAPGLKLPTVFLLCHPRGLPGLTIRPGSAGAAHEQAEFWKEVEHVRSRLPMLRRLPLPPDRLGGQ
ncbi:MAG: hypothetical protein HY236_12140 [Acidobacteria bacterium]|nr:hypothetical protein [Acidobacteriota bacterium]